MKIKPHLKEALKKFLIEKVKMEEQKIKVISPYELTYEEKELLKNQLKSFNWHEVDYMIDPSILAGVVVKQGSRSINLTLNERLADLKKIIYETDR